MNLRKLLVRTIPSLSAVLLLWIALTRPDKKVDPKQPRATGKAPVVVPAGTAAATAARETPSPLPEWNDGSRAERLSGLNGFVKLLVRVRSGLASPEERRRFRTLAGKINAWAWADPEQYLSLVDLVSEVDVPSKWAMGFVDLLFGRRSPLTDPLPPNHVKRLLNRMRTAVHPLVLLAAAVPIYAHDASTKSLSQAQTLLLLDVAEENRNERLSGRLISAAGRYAHAYPELIVRIAGIARDSGRPLDLRVKAADALSFSVMKHKEADDALMELLSRAYPDEVRLAATTALTPHPFSPGKPSDEIGPALIQSLQGETHPRILAATCEALCGLDSDSALDAIFRVAGSDAPPEVHNSIVDGFLIARFSARDRRRRALDLINDVVRSTRSEETRIGALNVVARHLGENLENLDKLMSAMRIVREQGSTATRKHLRESVLVELERLNEALLDHPEYVSLKTQLR